MSNYLTVWLWQLGNHAVTLSGRALAPWGHIPLRSSLRGNWHKLKASGGVPWLKVFSSHPLWIFPAAFLGPRMTPIGIQMREAEAKKTVKSERVVKEADC